MRGPGCRRSMGMASPQTKHHCNEYSSRPGGLQEIPLDGTRRLAAEDLHVALLGHYPLLQMELFGGGSQVGPELDGAVPIVSLPAIHVVEFHAAAVRITLGDLDDAVRGDGGGSADGRYDRSGWLCVAVVADSPGRIARRHLRAVGGRERRL